MTTTAAFAADALETNRQGRLTDDQRKGWVGVERAWSGNFRFAAVACALLGLGLLTGVLSNRADPTRYLGGIGFLVAAGVFAYISVFAGRPLERDLRDGRVASVDGALGRDRQDGPGTTAPTTYWLVVAGRRYECTPTAYRAAEEPGQVRLYYLPRTRKVVNFERLPDRPVPDGALVDRAVLDAVARDARSHDRATRDEAMATMEALKHAALGPAPAPGTDAGARPTASAVVGTWRGPFVEATFAADGTASASMANGMRLDGRWSIDDSGELRLDGSGGQLATDARISGDTLTLTVDSMPLTLHRAAG